jgi:hypothetical protein
MLGLSAEAMFTRPTHAVTSALARASHRIEGRLKAVIRFFGVCRETASF